MEYKEKKFPSWGCSVSKGRHWKKQMANSQFLVQNLIRVVMNLIPEIKNLK